MLLEKKIKSNWEKSLNGSDLEQIRSGQDMNQVMHLELTFICNCICINIKKEFLDYADKHNHFDLKSAMKIKLFTQLLKLRVHSSKL